MVSKLVWQYEFGKRLQNYFILLTPFNSNKSGIGLENTAQKYDYAKTSADTELLIFVKKCWCQQK